MLNESCDTQNCGFVALDPWLFGPPSFMWFVYVPVLSALFTARSLRGRSNLPQQGDAVTGAFLHHSAELLGIRSRSQPQKVFWLISLSDHSRTISIDVKAGYKIVWILYNVFIKLYIYACMYSTINPCMYVYMFWYYTTLGCLIKPMFGLLAFTPVSCSC